MYTQEERQIFDYECDGKTVWGDPLEIELKLAEALGGNQAATYRDYNSEDAALSGPATLKLIAAVRVAFDMPFDKATGKGATAKECCKALWAFWDWVKKNEQTAEASPTGLPSTGASPATDPSPTPSSRR